jgi:hypothetical protein
MAPSSPISATPLIGGTGTGKTHSGHCHRSGLHPQRAKGLLHASIW